MEDKLIPLETTGKNTNLETSVLLDTKEEAELTFTRAYNRMLNPAVWHKLCGPASAEFMLTNDHAKEESRLAKEGDFFKIDIPGPGPSKGEGYDWVKVELIEDRKYPAEDEERAGMKLRAAAPPTKNENETAHFFNRDATSSFLLGRKGNKITASYHGRNEVPNTDTENTADNIRNSMVAMGAIAGLSELQWSTLLKGFLEKEIV